MRQLLIIMGLFSFLTGCKDKPQKETLNVDGEAINTTTKTEDYDGFKLSNLPTEQSDFIKQNLTKAKAVVAKYAGQNQDKPFDSKTLDIVLQKWAATTGSKEQMEEIIDVIGAAFGQGIADELNCEWKVISDQYGTDITVIHKKYIVNSFPFSSVQKAVTEANPRSLNDIKLILKNQIESADNSGEVELRK